MTLSCKVNGQDYNVLRDAKLVVAGQKLAAHFGIRKDDYVLVSIFAPSKDITSDIQNKSAVCIYTLKEIEEMFNENIHLCFNGTVKERNLDYISGSILDGKCPYGSGNVHDFCSAGLKISGIAPIVANSMFHFHDELITSVACLIVGSHNIAFLGTNEGKIKKVLISELETGEYDSVNVDPGHAILPDSLVSPDQNFLYVLSKKKVTKMKIENCAEHTTCTRCLDSKDPFCGWCSLEKKCTVRSACQRDTSASRWLSVNYGQQCIDFENVIPEKLQIGQTSSVNLIIKTLPELPTNAKYKCVFGNSSVPIEATVTDNGLIW